MATTTDEATIAHLRILDETNEKIIKELKENGVAVVQGKGEVTKKDCDKYIKIATNEFITETMDELLAFREDLENQYKNTN